MCIRDRIYTSYSQHDTRWSSNPLGSSKDPMGCLLYTSGLGADCRRRSILV